MPVAKTESKSLIVLPSEAEIAATEKVVTSDLGKLRKEVLKLHQKVTRFAEQAIYFAILCGMVLLRIKKFLKHGEFNPWVESNFAAETGLGVRTAQRYMAKARAFIDFLNAQGCRCESDADLQEHLDSPLATEFIAFSKQLGSALRRIKDDANEWRSPAAVIAAVTAVLGRIDCDPCALSEPWGADLAEINFTPKEDGLSDGIAWSETAWVCPGHETDAVAWYLKAQREMELGHLREAILCLPESTVEFPAELLRFPIAITPQPLTVTFRKSGESIEMPLPTRSLFVYVSTERPDVDKFAHAFRDVALVFTPVA